MSAEFNEVKESLVDKILTQGQRLRNAMVQSILQNDPLSSDIIYNKPYNTPVTSVSSLGSKEDKKLLEAFISGDYLTRDQEDIALNTIRSIPLSDMCETTQEAFLSKCSCATCTAYHKNNLKCDLRRSPNCNKNYPSKPDVAQNKDSIQVLKQVDSLKVVLQSIHLNSLGNKKVAQGLNKKHLNSGLNETYFVEYYIPEIFSKEVPKSKSKTDSGLENSHVKVCARKTSNVVHIRQTFVHSVCNLYDCNLDDHDITFFVKYKSTGQRTCELLGIAKFNLGLFKNARNASCGKTLPIYLHDESPITVGTLKVTLQLGAGKLYFGQEFLDAVLLPRTSLTTDSSEEASDIPVHENNLPVDTLIPKTFVKKETKSEKPKASTKSEKPKVSTKPIAPILQPEVGDSACLQQFKSEDHKTQPVDERKPSVIEFQGEILFGFLYISEAQFLNVAPTSFLLCQPYCQNGTSTSRVVFNNSNPLYNFCQTVPLLYEQNLLLKLRENFMLIEFWQKSEQTDEVFGLTRLPLHQFYLGYRNAIILKHLQRNKLPIIGTDWWEPIYSVDNNELIGQVQVLTALGTEDQIKNLETERGFRDDLVKAKFLNSSHIKAKRSEGAKQPSSYFGDRAKVNKKPLKHENINESRPLEVKQLKTPRSVTVQKLQKCDVAVQSDIDISNMDLKANTSKPPQAQDMITSFLKLLEDRQRPPCVENSTNTEPAVCSGTSSQMPKTDPTPAPQLRKTSDLLDSLQKALSLDSVPVKKVEKPPSFKAIISINGANQLPSRRRVKSKAKRMKGKSLKQEENVLPSTYVTFETMPGNPLQVTSVFPKSTSPQWNYRCEVSLPRDLLTNGQKRLIFKVWKKCTNAVLQPNMQTDLVLGFAALDLSVLSVGLPSVQGWFNIIDFSGKCNGQINIHVNPTEKVQKVSCPKPEVVTVVNSGTDILNEMPENEECNELLSRALKRKFSELDEITQRLRLRLSEVVSEDSEGSNDDITDEFENDINNLCVEDDFDLINFEESATKSDTIQCRATKRDKSSTSMLSLDAEPGTSQPTREENIDTKKLKSDSSGLLTAREESGTASESSTSRSLLYSDKHIIEGKHRIDTLLEKLSLITAEASQPFSCRYVSGCSAVSNEVGDVQEIFKDLEQHSRPNITAANSFDPVLFQQLYGGSISSNLANGNSNSNLGSGPGLSGGSDTSVITDFSDCRPKPDGEGTSDGKGT